MQLVATMKMETDLEQLCADSAISVCHVFAVFARVLSPDEEIDYDHLIDEFDKIGDNISQL